VKNGFQPGTRVYVTRQHNSVWGGVPMIVRKDNNPDSDVVLVDHPTGMHGGFKTEFVKRWSSRPKSMLNAKQRRKRA
jgi:hypothetical protein